MSHGNIHPSEMLITRKTIYLSSAASPADLSLLRFCWVKSTSAATTAYHPGFHFFPGRNFFSFHLPKKFFHTFRAHLHPFPIHRGDNRLIFLTVFDTVKSGNFDILRDSETMLLQPIAQTDRHTVVCTDNGFRHFRM